MAEPRIRVFVDDSAEPVSDYAPPADITINSRTLTDGEHRLRIEARDANGEIGVRFVPFFVRNGPGIAVAGIADGEVVHGSMSFHVNVFSATEAFEAKRAETRSPAPLWIWVLGLALAAWSLWYLASNWDPPEQYARTPTFAPR
jgi:hypothetical protein